MAITVEGMMVVCGGIAAARLMTKRGGDTDTGAGLISEYGGGLRLLADTEISETGPSILMVVSSVKRKLQVSRKEDRTSIHP